MKTIKEVLEPIKEIDNVRISKCTDEEPLLFIPTDKTYFEILGHRVETGENMKSMDDIANWLKRIKEVEIENEQLKKQMAEFGEYVITKYEEAKLNAYYVNKERIATMQEIIYEDILYRMELK